ncbi:(p)ppGpp synthetase [Treponema vincentii]|uniref:RelA/SpoT domain-containing protein n=1 Tax=Treponema TaxID=157 RepID=UPI001BAECC96|nr:(p)ppGpp synthetase [Treponema vincentii]
MMSFNTVWIPDKNQLKKQYNDYHAHFVVLLKRLEDYLRSIVKVSALPAYKTRVKSFDSYYEKLLKFPPADPSIKFPVVTDLIGIRIVCPFLQNLGEVENILVKNFTVKEVERKGADRTFREFGYESTHVLADIPESFTVGLLLPENLIFEVQIRTILQDAWAEVEHELIYKFEFSPFDFPLKRKFASINASLSLADILFQEIRDAQNSLNTELDKRREQFYSRADEFTKDLLGDSSEIEEKSNEGVMNISALETIDSMIFHAIRAHNRGDFPTAETLYTKILNQKPNALVASIVYKHRGMAFFAQGAYKNAYKDFSASLDENPKNFRSYYYAGIVLMMMDKNLEAITMFTKSLEINGYQAHVYFRRALAYFQENQLIPALHDLDNASALGLPSEEEKKLREAIAKKIDMV